MATFAPSAANHSAIAPQYSPAFYILEILLDEVYVGPKRLDSLAKKRKELEKH